MATAGRLRAGEGRPEDDATQMDMISISITAEAFEAIKASLSELDNPAPPPGKDGLIRVWLDRATFDRLSRLSGPSESYSDVILRMANGS